MKYAPNKIKIDFAGYRHYWRGVKKIGKTTLFRDIVKEAYGDYKYGFLIAPGNESGFKALDGVYATEAPTWGDFVDVVDDLVENKQDNEFKVIAIDTVDELVSIASDQTLKVHYQRKDEKVHSLNAALGGYGSGHQYVAKIINDQIKRLEGAGYGLVFIGHTKIRDIKEKNMDEPYQQLTSNLESRFDSIFTDKADLIATMYVNKDVKDKELVGVERFIYFRSDGFVDAGSRFANMPEKIPMTAKAYLEAFEQGVKSSFKSNVSNKELEKMKTEEIAEKESNANKFIEESKSVVDDDENKLETAEDYIEAIAKVLAKMDKETQKEKRAELKDRKIPADYKNQKDIEILKKFWKVVSNN